MGSSCVKERCKYHLTTEADPCVSLNPSIHLSGTLALVSTPIQILLGSLSTPQSVWFNKQELWDRITWDKKEYLMHAAAMAGWCPNLCFLKYNFFVLKNAWYTVLWFESKGSSHKDNLGTCWLFLVILILIKKPYFVFIHDVLISYLKKNYFTILFAFYYIY